MSYMAFLPRHLWRTCGWCGGTGSRELAEDCHRSGGIIPCDCGDGWVQYDLVEKTEYDRRKAAGELADHHGRLLPPEGRASWTAPVVSVPSPHKPFGLG